MPEHQPRDITKDREAGKPFGHGCSMSHALPLWGPGNPIHSLPGLWVKCCGEPSRARGIREDSSPSGSVLKGRDLPLASLLLPCFSQAGSGPPVLSAGT